MKKRQEPIIDMSRYVDSEPIVDDCEGCEKVFDWHGDEGTIVVQKCLAYPIPAAKWPRKGEKVVTDIFTIRERDETGKAIGLKEVELPVIIKRCQLATHYVGPEIVEMSGGKVRAGQQKTKRRNRI